MTNNFDSSNKDICYSTKDFPYLEPWVFHIKPYDQEWSVETNWLDTTEDDYNGFEYRIKLGRVGGWSGSEGDYPDSESLEHFLYSGETQSLIQRIYDGFSMVVSPFDRPKGELDEDAQSALDELEEGFNSLPTVTFSYWDNAEDYFPDANPNLITAEMNDEEVSDVATKACDLAFEEENVLIDYGEVYRYFIEVRNHLRNSLA